MKMKMKKTTLALTLSVTLGLLSGCGEKSPEETIALGNKMLTEQNYRAAGIEFKTALQNDPALVDARVGLAMIALASRDFSGALVELEKAKATLLSQNQSTRDVDTLISRALHNDESGIALLELDAKGVPEILYYQVSALLRDKQVEDAQTRLNTAVEPNGFSALAQALITAYPLEPQARLATLPETGSDPIYNAELALVKTGFALQAQQMDVAIAAMGDYYKTNAADTSRALQYAHMLTSGGHYERAQEVISPLVKRFPNHGMVNEIYAVTLYNQKLYEKAQSAAVIANVANPNGIMSRLIAAYSAVKLDNREDALDNLSFIVDKLPSDHDAKRLYIQLKAGNGDFEQLSEDALALTSLTANDVPLLSSLGLEMVRRGELEKAKKLAAQAQSVTSTDEGSVGLGLLQMSLDQKTLAFETLESALAANPESMLAGNSLVNAYIAEGQLSKAQAIADTWMTQGKVVESKVLSGVLATKANKHTEALAHFDAALAADPAHFLARSGKIEVLLLSSQQDNAQALLKQWIVEPNMLGLFRHYMSTLRQLRAEDGIKQASTLLKEWLDAGILKGDDATYLSAQTAFLARDFDLSLTQLHRLEGSDKAQLADYWLLRSNIALQYDDHQGAEQAYQRWLEVNPADPMPILGLVQSLAKQGKYQEAGAFLDRTLPQVKNKTPGYLLRAHLYMMERNPSGVKKQLNQLPDNVQQSPLGQALEGFTLLFDKQFEQAEQKLLPYVNSTGNEDFLRWLVAAQGAQGKKHHVQQTLSEHLLKKPDSALAHFMLGNEKVAASQYDAALKHYQAALKHGEGNPVLQNNLAYTLWKQGDFSQAKTHAEKAVGMLPKNGSFVETYANILFDLGQKTQAIDAMEKLLSEGGAVNEAFEATYQRLKAN